MSGKIVEDFLTRFDISQQEGLKQFNHHLHTTGVGQLLKKEGVKTGDLIYLKNVFFG